MSHSHEISKLIKAFPKDIAALDKRSVLAKVNSQGSGRLKPYDGIEMNHLSFLHFALMLLFFFFLKIGMVFYQIMLQTNFKKK